MPIQPDCRGRGSVATKVARYYYSTRGTVWLLWSPRRLSSVVTVAVSILNLFFLPRALLRHGSKADYFFIFIQVRAGGSNPTTEIRSLVLLDYTFLFFILVVFDLSTIVPTTIYRSWSCFWGDRVSRFRFFRTVFPVQFVSISDIMLLLNID